MGGGAEYWVGEDRQGEGALWPGGSKDPTPTQSSPFTHSFNVLLQGTHYRSRLVLVSGGQRAPVKPTLGLQEVSIPVSTVGWFL